jgi:hypothetical protein
MDLLKGGYGWKVFGAVILTAIINLILLGISIIVIITVLRWLGVIA